MTIKAISFNTDMVNAILSGRKTMARRIMEPQPIFVCSECDTRWWWKGNRFWWKNDCDPMKAITEKHSPFKTGDILYVREAWATLGRCPVFKAENPNLPCKWHPSFLMPKEFTRIFLRVTNIHVERLQDMTDDDVVAEGAEPFIQCPLEHPIIEADGTTGDMCWNTGCCSSCEYIEKSYGELFGEKVWNNSISKADLPDYGWDANPWVWCISFKMISKDEVWCELQK